MRAAGSSNVKSKPTGLIHHFQHEWVAVPLWNRCYWDFEVKVTGRSAHKPQGYRNLHRICGDSVDTERGLRKSDQWQADKKQKSKGHISNCGLPDSRRSTN